MFERLVRHFREDNSWTVLRTGISVQNKPGLAFARRLGFQSYKQIANRIASGMQEFVLLEIAL